MLALYYFPCAISTAAHILMNEGGEEWEPHTVSFDEAGRREFEKVNPRCLVPALRLDNGDILTENVAVLPYLAKRFGLWPEDPILEAKSLSVIGYFASSTAPAAALTGHPYRFTTDQSAVEASRQAGINNYAHHMAETDRMLEGREWLMDEYGACDAYALALYGYAVRKEVPVAGLKNMAALRDRMLERPAVKKTVESEGVNLYPTV